MSQRRDILEAVLEAERLHAQFDSRARAEAGEGRIDVFEMLVRRNVPVIFRPLKNLLGAFVDDPDRGIIVTTQRPLPIQRFTAAHELGHEALGHQASYDEEDLLTRALFVTDERFDPREIQANAFASQLLAPPWLIVLHMERQGWTRKHLTNPLVVYQLSLRIGSSYSATCYALERSKAISALTRGLLLTVQPKTIKQELIAPHVRDDWRGDVWLVTERDDGMVLDGGRSDLVVLSFEEHASSGYIWQFGDIGKAGLAIREDERTSPAREDHVGGIVFRTVIAEPESAEGARGHVLLREIRLWQAAGEPLRSLELDLELSGPVRSGLLPAQREALLQVA